MKKLLLSVVVIIICLLVAVSVIRNGFTDRFNPFLEMEHSYAKVEKGTQNYDNVQAFDKYGEKLPYKLDFNGFDPNKEYVDILHKGKYVKEIRYIKSLPSDRK